VHLVVRAVHEWPTDALADLASTSRLLVVGRHHQHPLVPKRLGSVARAAIRTASCPVMVVPVDAA
jgi:nucleotide-binding universal stress UspA family protein